MRHDKIFLVNSVLFELVGINMVSYMLQILNNYRDGMRNCVPRNSLLQGALYYISGLIKYLPGTCIGFYSIYEAC